MTWTKWEVKRLVPSLSQKAWICYFNHFRTKRKTMGAHEGNTSPPSGCYINYKLKTYGVDITLALVFWTLSLEQCKQWSVQIKINITSDAFSLYSSSLRIGEMTMVGTQVTKIWVKFRIYLCYFSNLIDNVHLTTKYILIWKFLLPVSFDKLRRF